MQDEKMAEVKKLMTREEKEKEKEKEKLHCISEILSPFISHFFFSETKL